MASFTLNEDGSYSPTGGTAIAFTASGKEVTGGKEYINAAETNFFARESVALASRAPALGSDGRYSKQKCDMVIRRPATLASGEVVQNLVRVTFEIHPESGATVSDNLRSIVLSALSDTELLDFIRYGAIPA